MNLTGSVRRNCTLRSKGSGEPTTAVIGTAKYHFSSLRRSGRFTCGVHKFSLQNLASFGSIYSRIPAIIMFPIPALHQASSGTSAGATATQLSSMPSPSMSQFAGKMPRSHSSSGRGKACRYTPYPSVGNVSNMSFVPSVPLVTRSALLCNQCFGTSLYHEYTTQRLSIETARYQDLCNDPSSSGSAEIMYDEIHAKLLDDLEEAIRLGRPMLTVDCSAQIDACRQGSWSTSNGQHQAAVNLNAISDHNVGLQQSMVSMPSSAHAQIRAQDPPRRARDAIPSKPSSVPDAIVAFKCWYDSHQDHPYPDSHEYAIFSDVTGVAVQQIKNWFAKERRKNNMAKSRKDIAAHLKAHKLSPEDRQKADDELRFEMMCNLHTDRAN